MEDAAAEAVETPDSAAPDEPVEQPTDEAPGGGDEPTGVASVDAALERLRDLEGAPVEAHVQIFDDVQRQLHEALAELEE